MTPTQAEIEQAKEICAMAEGNDMPSTVKRIAQAIADSRANVERDAELLVGWAEDTAPEMGCRYYEKCDHCNLLSLIFDWRERHPIEIEQRGEENSHRGRRSGDEK